MVVIVRTSARAAVVHLDDLVLGLQPREERAERIHTLVLHTETDQAILPLIGMELIGTPWIFQELSKWGLPDDQAVYRAQRAQARAAANQWKRLTLEHPKVRKQHWPSVLTVRSRDNFGYGFPSVLTPG